MFENLAFTAHFQQDRADRMANILTKLAVGTIVAKKACGMDDTKYYQFTDTGIMFVVSKTNNAIITAYLPTPKQVSGIFEGHAPQALFSAVVRNSKNKKLAYLYD